MADPTEDERDYMAGFMRARLSRGYEAEVYPLVEGLRPIHGPELIAPGRWLATWLLAQGGTLVVEARSAGGEWHVIVVGRQPGRRGGGGPVGVSAKLRPPLPTTGAPVLCTRGQVRPVSVRSVTRPPERGAPASDTDLSSTEPSV